MKHMWGSGNHPWCSLWSVIGVCWYLVSFLIAPHESLSWLQIWRHPLTLIRWVWSPERPAGQYFAPHFTTKERRLSLWVKIQSKDVKLCLACLFPEHMPKTKDPLTLSPVSQDSPSKTNWRNLEGWSFSRVVHFLLLGVLRDLLLLLLT